MDAQFGEAEAHGAQTGLAAAAIVVLVGYVFERAGFECGVGDGFAKVGVERIHWRNLAPSDCGLSMYNSYSVGREQTLDGREHAVSVRIFLPPPRRSTGHEQSSRNL
jgi:hypothetical protein